MPPPAETDIEAPTTMIPQWDLPRRVRAIVTLRRTGGSIAPYDSFNLGDHVGELGKQVLDNRRRLVETLQLTRPPNWLQQIHSATVVDASDVEANPEADAIYVDKPGPICAVLTADCLPILLASSDGLEIAAVHAGWRGLLAGVVAAASDKFRAPKHKISAWLGPSISAHHYEVGADLRDKFVLADKNYASAFHDRENAIHMGLAEVATLQLARLGVGEIINSGICTFARARDFYSYRRDGVTGRFASLIWRER